MLVKDVMSDDVVAVRPDEPVEEGARLLCRYNIGSVPVCTSGGQVKGVLTDRDIVLRCVAQGLNPASTPIEKIMSGSVITASPEDDLIQASKLMAKDQVRRLPIVSGGRLVGMLSLGDVARMDGYDMEAADALSEISLNIRRMRR